MIARVDAISTIAPLRGAQRLVGGAGKQVGSRQVDIDDAPPFRRSSSWRSGFSWTMPALETSASRRPNFSVTAFDRVAATVSSSATSPSIRAARRALPRIGAGEAGARQVDHADAPAVIEQVPCDGAPDAVSGAGDECDFRFGICHWLLSTTVIIWLLGLYIMNAEVLQYVRINANASAYELLWFQSEFVHGYTNDARAGAQRRSALCLPAVERAAGASGAHQAA